MGVRFEAGKLSRRLASRVVRRLFHDPVGDPGRCILVAGTARSGTTWLADLIAARVPCRMMFEPFHHEKIDALEGVPPFPFLRPGDRHPALEGFCERLFTGAIRDPWIDREVRRLFPRRRLIKEIRANGILRWIHERHPEVRMMLVVRHPCAVAASRIGLGWATDGDLDPLLAQPALGEVVPLEILRRVRRDGSVAAKHAAIWSAAYLAPLRQFGAGGIPCLFYERLVAEPERELPRAFAAAGLPYDPAVLERLAVPSTTAVRSSAIARGEPALDGWSRRLSAAEVDDVLAVVEAFGLGGLYDRSPMPRARDPWDGLAPASAAGR